jgi:hypothetical protein
MSEPRRFLARYPVDSGQRTVRCGHPHHAPFQRVPNYVKRPCPRSVCCTARPEGLTLRTRRVSPSAFEERGHETIPFRAGSRTGRCRPAGRRDRASSSLAPRCRWSRRAAPLAGRLLLSDLARSARRTFLRQAVAMSRAETAYAIQGRARSPPSYSYGPPHRAEGRQPAPQGGQEPGRAVAAGLPRQIFTAEADPHRSDRSGRRLRRARLGQSRR